MEGLFANRTGLFYAGFHGMKQKALVLLLLLLFSSALFADQVDDRVNARMADHHVPGAAVAVIKNGKIVKMRGYGLASIEFAVPVSTKSVFEIGSVSKQMTAAAIMLLVEDGKLSVDDPVSKYLANTPEAWKEVTIRHLLTHTSGVKSYTSLEGFDLIKRQKVDDFIKKLSPYPLEFTPGERNIYSNSGFTLLAYVIETVSGKKYMDFMQERIFRPLGMVHTADRDPQYIIPNRATGYEWNGDRYTGRSWDLTDLIGAGTIVSTIEDMIKWDLALRDDKFLKPESRKMIWTQFTFNNGQPSPYGFGWRISDVRGHKLIGHTGQTAGFAAANYRFVNDDVAVIVLTNSGESDLGAAIAMDVAKVFLPSMSIRAMKPLAADAVITELVRKGFAQRAENRLTGDVFTPEMVRALSTDRARIGNQRIADAGPIKTLDLVGTERDPARKVYIYRAETSRGASLWRIGLTEEKKISLMTLQEKE